MADDGRDTMRFPKGLELGLAGGVAVRFTEVEIETRGTLREPAPDFALRLGATLGDVRLLQTAIPQLGGLLAQVAMEADHVPATLELTAGPRHLRRIAQAAKQVGPDLEPWRLARDADWMTAVFDLGAYDPGYLSVVQPSASPA